MGAVEKQCGWWLHFDLEHKRNKPGSVQRKSGQTPTIQSPQAIKFFLSASSFLAKSSLNLEGNFFISIWYLQS